MDRYTIKDACKVKRLIEVAWPYTTVEIIGSLGKGKEYSEHDIDILVSCKKTVRFRNRIMKALQVKQFENTDWGGWYFRSELWGNIDIFFSTKKFDH